MAKIVNAALKAKATAAKANAIGPEAKAKTIKIGLEAKAWPRGLHHWLLSNTFNLHESEFVTTVKNSTKSQF